MFVRRFLLTAIIGLLFLSPLNANAHAQVTARFPESGSKVQTIPDEVWVEFDGNLTEIQGAKVNSLMVFNNSGERIDNGVTVIAGARVSVGIANSDVNGKVIVQYRVVSEDGHPVEGTYSFVNEAKLSSPREVSSDEPSTKVKSTESASSNSKEIPLRNSQSPKNVSHSEHEQQGFFQLHREHLIQFIAALFLLGIWTLFRRYNRE